MFCRVAVLMLACAIAVPVQAQVLVKNYAQELVDRTVAANPDLLVVMMHVTPPTATDNIVVASNSGRQGKLGDEDDMRVINTGKPNIEVTHSGNFEVELVMRDVVGDTIGALGLVWPYTYGQDKAAFERNKVAFEKKAESIRDGLAKRVLNTANLMDPYPFEAGATTRTHAQKIVDEVQAKSPEVLVLAMRAPPKGAKDIVVLGSTFGRHGKKADADDLKILTATEPATGVYSGGKRFGVDLPLRDVSGKTIGTMNVGYAYRQGDDQAALVKKAVQLRDDLQKRIKSSDQLDELDP
jgi:hypothetical protein